MSNIATDDLGRVILTDISRTSVSRSESKAAASLQMTSRMFFESIDELLRQPAHASSERSDESPGPRGPTGFAFYSYRQDATHHRIKKSTLELETGIIIDHQEYNHRTPFMDTARTLRQLSDVLNITDESSAGTLAFTRKALASLGCPFVDTIQEWNKSLGWVQWLWSCYVSLLSGLGTPDLTFPSTSSNPVVDVVLCNCQWRCSRAGP